MRCAGAASKRLAAIGAFFLVDGTRLVKAVQANRQRYLRHKKNYPHQAATVFATPAARGERSRHWRTNLRAVK